MKRNEIRAALSAAKKLVAGLEAMLGVQKTVQVEMLPEVREKVERRICLVCGLTFPKPEKYQRGRCWPHYQNFYYDSKQDPGLEARLIAEGTLAPEQTGGRKRRIYTGRRVEEAPPEKRNEVMAEEALKIIQQVERDRKKKR